MNEEFDLNGANLLKLVLTHPFSGRCFRNVSGFGGRTWFGV
jgi:hypothetical protein